MQRLFDRLSRFPTLVRVVPFVLFLLLARASKPEQEAFIGDQTGGRVFLFLHTDDFWRDYNEMVDRGVRFVLEPVAPTGPAPPTRPVPLDDVR